MPRTVLRPVALALGIVVAGCTALPERRAASTAPDVPLSGLPERWRVVAVNRPVELVNLGDAAAAKRREEQDREARRAALDQTTGEAASGAIQAVASHPVLWLTCIYPPLCMGLVAGTALAARGAHAMLLPRSALDAEEDGAMAAAMRARLTSTALRSAVESELAKDAGEYPLLAVHLESAWIDLVGGHPALALKARAQAFLSAQTKWPPTEHRVATPSRTAQAWLENDGALLATELDLAIEALARNIAATYYSEQGADSGDVEWAKVYIYRVDTEAFDGYAEIAVNGEPQFSLPNRRYGVLRLPAGTHELQAALPVSRMRSPGAARKIDVERGRAYYVRFASSAGNAAAELLRAPTPQGIRQIATLQAVEPHLLESTKRTERERIERGRAEREKQAATQGHLRTETERPYRFQSEGPGGPERGVYQNPIECGGRFCR